MMVPDLDVNGIDERVASELRNVNSTGVHVHELPRGNKNNTLCELSQTCELKLPRDMVKV